MEATGCEVFLAGWAAAVRRESCDAKRGATWLAGWDAAKAAERRGENPRVDDDRAMLAWVRLEPTTPAVPQPKIVYTIVTRERDGKKFWVRIGSATTNRDGSLNVVLDAVPTNGTLHIRSASLPEGTEG